MERAVREHDNAVLNPRFVPVTGERHGNVVKRRLATLARLLLGAEPAPAVGRRTLHRLEDGDALAGRGLDGTGQDLPGQVVVSLAAA